MPIYEYACPSCGNQFELMQSFSASTEQDCPKCGAVATRKISQSGFVLKGSGFYLNDYVRKPEAEAKKETSTPIEKSGGGGTESPSTPAASTPSAASPAATSSPTSTGTSA